VPWKNYSEKNFPLKFRQTAGYHNSLGIIMFYFENTSSIYFHDTPAKSLFNSAFRALSHGCMRMQYPIAFAKSIMEFDNGIYHLPEEYLQEMGIYEKQKSKKATYCHVTSQKSDKVF
jgi:murein L,D-transpeptidase YcbB/YkuD